MNKIIIARKVMINNAEALDFAVDDNDALITFPTFKEASAFLKSELGPGEHQSNYIVTTIDAQRDNPALTALLSSTTTPVGTTNEPAKTEQLNSSEQGVECTFLLTGNDGYEIKENQAIVEKSTGKLMIPVLAFINPDNPSEVLAADGLVIRGVFMQTVELNGE